MKNIHLTPTEEQKQHLIDLMKGDEELGLYEEPKQETLEEAAEKYANELPEPYNYGINSDKKRGFIEGAKWRQEQILEFLYLEITERRDYSASKMCEVVIEFIEQFKKK